MLGLRNNNVYIVRFRHLYRLLAYEQLPIEWYNAIGAAIVKHAKQYAMMDKV